MKLCLIVDDSSVIRKVAGTILASLDYEIIETDNGQQAIDRCQVQMPDAILLDWHMPELGGQDFLTLFKRTFTGRQPWIIYATTENNPVDIARAIAAGADDYVIKPFTRADLEAKFSKMSSVRAA